MGSGKLQWGFTIQGSAVPDAGSCSFLPKLQVDASISDAESHKRTFEVGVQIFSISNVIERQAVVL